ncbi:MAG: manganese efflux pump MntP family protein [Bacteroidales bacterium]
MGIITLLLVAISLSFDSFAVSISYGMQPMARNKRIKFALILGLVQGSLPIFGWITAIHFAEYVSAFDHWIAFVLLTLIALHMLYEALPHKKPTEDTPKKAISMQHILLIAVATSIDAMVVGVSFAFIETITAVDLLYAALTIGGVTLIASLLGQFFGKKIGLKLGNRAEIIGAIILFAIGLKVLLEHICL